MHKIKVVEQRGDTTTFETEHKGDLLGGVTVLHGKVLDKNGKATTLTAIPYYVWSNRGEGKMSVWFERI